MSRALDAFHCANKAEAEHYFRPSPRFPDAFDNAFNLSARVAFITQWMKARAICKRLPLQPLPPSSRVACTIMSSCVATRRKRLVELLTLLSDIRSDSEASQSRSVLDFLLESRCRRFQPCTGGRDRHEAACLWKM